MSSPSLSHSVPQPNAENFIAMSTEKRERGHREISSFKIIPSLTKKAFLIHPKDKQLKTIWYLEINSSLTLFF